MITADATSATSTAGWPLSQAGIAKPPKTAPATPGRPVPSGRGAWPRRGRPPRTARTRARARWTARPRSRRGSPVARPGPVSGAARAGRPSPVRSRSTSGGTSTVASVPLSTPSSTVTLTWPHGSDVSGSSFGPARGQAGSTSSTVAFGKVAPSTANPTEPFRSSTFPLSGQRSTTPATVATATAASTASSTARGSGATSSSTSAPWPCPWPGSCLLSARCDPPTRDILPLWDRVRE